MIRGALLLAASTALLGNTAPADTAAQLTECELSYTQAMAVAGNLVALRTRPGDLMTAEKDEVTEYDTAGVSVLGIPATNFIRNDIIDDGEEQHIFRTTIAVPYAKARFIMMLRQGEEQCGKDNSGLIKSCFFELPHMASNGFDVTLSVHQVNAEESQVYCNYHRKR